MTSHPRHETRAPRSPSLPAGFAPLAGSLARAAERRVVRPLVRGASRIPALYFALLALVVGLGCSTSAEILERSKVVDQSLLKPESVLVAPVLAVRVEPCFPEKVRLPGLSAKVELDAIVTASGDVKVRKFLNSVGEPLDSCYREAAERWKYDPATVDGVPADVMMTLSCTFRVLR